MMPQKQLIKHNPSAGRYGDCYRTCVAIIMDLHADQVPHFCDKNIYTDDAMGTGACREWLHPQGLGLFQIFFPPDVHMEQLLHTLGTMSPGVPVIVTGKSSRGVGHCSVALDGKFVCDPHTGEASDAPFTGPCEGPDGDVWWWIDVIAKTSMEAPGV